MSRRHYHQSDSFDTFLAILLLITLPVCFIGLIKFYSIVWKLCF